MEKISEIKKMPAIPIEHNTYSRFHRKIMMTIFCFLTCTLITCRQNYTTPNNQDYATDEQNDTDTLVRVSPVLRGEFIQRLETSGFSKAKRNLTVRTQISGIVSALHVKAGQNIVKDQVILELETDDFDIALKEARADFLQSSIEYGKLCGERIINVSPDEFKKRGNLLDLQNAKDKLKVATDSRDEMELLWAQAEYEAAKLFNDTNKKPLVAFQSGLYRSYYRFLKAEKDRNNCTVKAPFAGVVGNIQIKQGDLVTPHDDCLALLDLSELIVEVELLETEINKIRAGKAASVCFSSVPGTSFSGIVYSINPIVDREKHTCTVELLIKNKDKLLLDGMFATAQIDFNSYENILMVPKTAVIERDNKTLLFIVRDGKAIWCYVECGLENDTFIEIKNSKFDLAEDDMVIIDGHYNLVHETPVKIQ